jgi:hypothetical protein
MLYNMTVEGDVESWLVGVQSPTVQTIRRLRYDTPCKHFYTFLYENWTGTMTWLDLYVVGLFAISLSITNANPETRSAEPLPSNLLHGRHS